MYISSKDITTPEQLLWSLAFIRNFNTYRYLEQRPQIDDPSGRRAVQSFMMTSRDLNRTTNSSSRNGWSGKVAGNVFSAAALVLMPISKYLRLTRVIYRYIWDGVMNVLLVKAVGAGVTCYSGNLSRSIDVYPTSQESTSQFFLLRDAHSSFLFSKWRVGRINRCYFVQCWEVRMSWLWCNCFALTDPYLL